MFKSVYRNQSHPDRQLDEAVLNWKGVFLMLFIFIGIQFLAVGVEQFLIPYVSQQFGVELGMMELNLIVDGVEILLMLLCFARFYGANLKNAFREFKAVYLWGPIACLAFSYVGSIIVQLILTMIRGEIQSTSNNELVTDMLLKNPLPMILLTVIIAPITEESVFRAALCRSMTSHKNMLVKIIGYTLSVSLFALMHVYQYAFLAVNEAGQIYLTFNANEFLSILNYIPMAIAFAVCATLCKNFWCSVACHMITNGIAVGMMLLLSMLSRSGMLS